jgi:hypothetical protein
MIVTNMFSSIGSNARVPWNEFLILKRLQDVGLEFESFHENVVLRCEKWMKSTSNYVFERVRD